MVVIVPAIRAAHRTVNDLWNPAWFIHILDFFSVSVHGHNVMQIALQEGYARDSQWPLEMIGIPIDLMSPQCFATYLEIIAVLDISQSIIAANWRPCLLTDW